MENVVDMAGKAKTFTTVEKAERKRAGLPAEPVVMSAAEFKVLRERLGLSAAWVARKLGTFERTLSRWETDAHPVREDAAELLRKVAAETSIVITQVAKKHKPGAVLRTYRYDERVDFQGKHGPYPASWHRAMIGRVAAVLDSDVRITYDD